MIRRPPRSTLPATLCPYPTLFRSRASGPRTRRLPAGKGPLPSRCSLPASDIGPSVMPGQLTPAFGKAWWNLLAAFMQAAGACEYWLTWRMKGSRACFPRTRITRRCSCHAVKSLRSGERHEYHDSWQDRHCDDDRGGLLDRRGEDGGGSSEEQRA